MRLARSNVRLLVLIAFYFLFIVIGASIFSTIEAPHENSVIRKLRAKRAAFLEEHPCVKGSCLFDFSNLAQPLFLHQEDALSVFPAVWCDP
ncbi:hypothetical protein MTO96_027001 [Rhipicephalus appendiculatus]